MSEYIISCPVCKRRYKLAPKDTLNLDSGQFTCPHCKYSAPFRTLLGNLPAPPPPPPVSNATSTPPVHSATRVVQNAAQKPIASLTVVGSPAKFALTPGVYVLGRRSSDSQASLQLAPDITMSRQHARLAMQFVTGRLVAQVVGLKADNPVVVNGKLLPAGRPCNLKSGDRLLLGSTQVVFTVN